jgi:hypothetical protein
MLSGIVFGVLLLGPGPWQPIEKAIERIASESIAILKRKLHVTFVICFKSP